MNYPVIVQRNSAEEYIAEPLGKPELKAVAPTETEALTEVGKALGQWLGSGKIVEVEVPGGGSGNPWLEAWGRSVDDPDFEDYLAEIERASATASCRQPGSAYRLHRTGPRSDVGYQES
jgi:hypothetical protein